MSLWTPCTSCYLQQWDVHMPLCCRCPLPRTPSPLRQDISWSKTWYEPNPICPSELLWCLLLKSSEFMLTGKDRLHHEHPGYTVSLSGHEHVGSCHVWLEHISRMGSSHQQHCSCNKYEAFSHPQCHALMCFYILEGASLKWFYTAHGHNSGKVAGVTMEKKKKKQPAFQFNSELKGS